MPDFLRSLLKLFNVELPRPYYLVKDGFLYMSESPQNLAAVYEASQTGNLLAAQKRWQDLSKDMDVKTSAALYYNLARSVPFFLKKQNTITDILSLYNIGRADLAIKDKALTFSLNALSVETNDPRLLPGFPFETKGDSDGKLIAEDGKKCGAIFWTEDNSSIHSLELSTFRQESIQIEKLSSIAAAKKSSSSKGVLWAVTDDGEIYLLTRDLKVIDGYPKVTGIRPSAPCAVPAQNELLIPCANGKLYHLKEDSGQEFIFDDATFKSAPTCLDGYAAIYNKGFLGSIYFAKNREWDQDKFFNIDQIAFGSPCLIKDKKGECLAAFITQNGAFYLFNLDTEEVVPGFPIETNSLFFSNVVYSNGYFFALSADASLYRIDFNGDFIALKIPDAQSAEHGTICAIPKGVAVCADKNIVWAWTNEMEIIGGFPVAGFGTPVIAEANGDRKPDCFVLSRDKKLYAWNGASLSISK